MIIIFHWEFERNMLTVILTSPCAVITDWQYGSTSIVLEYKKDKIATWRHASLCRNSKKCNMNMFFMWYIYISKGISSTEFSKFKSLQSSIEEDRKTMSSDLRGVVFTRSYPVMLCLK
jgi:hypothetical protein